MKISKRVFLIITFVLSILTCYFYAQVVEEKFMDDEFVESLHLPSDADSVGIPILGAFIVSIIFLIIHVILHILLFIFSRISKDLHISFSIYDGRLKPVIILLRTVVLALATWLAKDYYKNFTKVYIYEALFISSLILLLIGYMEWIIFFINKGIRTINKSALEAESK
ncbi:hypothetical protein [Paenibacillus sp. N3.4]|uniref:hypothetical protein n=1 Tax=Paenibacillus sp. N3.4 TaxID=2603222 RepID=UPI0011CA3BDF|nr:hypothetical protein [Paenibacillus sp. N3.4]TXK80674.1 hypothetical protein FU659_17795 [Paenibacillus sp. N3.4]